MFRNLSSVSDWKSTFREGKLTIKDRDDTDLDNAVEPALNVLGSEQDILLRVVTRPVAITVSFRKLGTTLHDGFVFVVQEVRRLVVLRDSEDTSESEENCDDAFENVKPERVLVC